MDRQRFPHALGALLLAACILVPVTHALADLPGSQGDPAGWPRSTVVVESGEPLVLRLEQRGVDAHVVRVTALEPNVTIEVRHGMWARGESVLGAIGLARSVLHVLDENGEPRSRGGLSLYDSGTGMVGVRDGEPVRYGVDACEVPERAAGGCRPSSWWNRLVIQPDEPGLLWHSFSTFEDGEYAHELTVTGAARVTVLHPGPSTLRWVGPDAFDALPVVYGRHAWVYAADATAEVPIGEPWYGRLSIGDGTLDDGAVVRPDGTVLGPGDGLRQVGLLQPGSWSFRIPPGHYGQLPAQFVGVETPRSLWDLR